MNKNLLLVCALTVLSFYSCRKCYDIPQKPKGKTELLTGPTWVYDTIYRYWGLPKQSTIYIKGSDNNAEDWSLEEVKFNKDGTFNEVLPNGGLRNGWWYFNNDSTHLITYDYQFSNDATIESLTDKQMKFLDEINHVRAVMVPKE
ncbi:hypothetical protein [Foetidibacter luteolus]|uniref:hypothetical protein n=1 Tax=Foetidibacter luteolus TaxID=2608880 RepID=UPI00129A8C40|nr:hypothetical protein [Foetidibacter luteolus]